MTKRQLIELIQERLASGDVPNDLLGRYKYQTISALISVIYQQLSNTDTALLDNMVMPYDYTVTQEGSTYIVNLDVSPSTGPSSLKYITDCCGNIYYSRQSSDQNLFLNRIKNMSKPEFYVRGKKVIWTCSPNSDTVTVYMIPNFIDMGEDEEVVMPSSVGSILSAVIELMRSTDVKPEEVINNSSEDNTPKQTNFA